MSSAPDAADAAGCRSSAIVVSVTATDAVQDDRRPAAPAGRWSGSSRSCGFLRSGSRRTAGRRRHRAPRRSWKMPTMARAARLGLLDHADTTTAAFAASSEAVGSSSSRIGWPPMKPRARLTRCCSPPEKVAGGSACRRRGMFRRSSSAAACARASAAVGAAADQHLGHHVAARRRAAPRAGTG